MAQGSGAVGSDHKVLTIRAAAQSAQGYLTGDTACAAAGLPHGIRRTIGSRDILPEALHHQQ